jgi:hypothetical protein
VCKRQPKTQKVLLAHDGHSLNAKMSIPVFNVNYIVETKSSQAKRFDVLKSGVDVEQKMGSALELTSSQHTHIFWTIQARLQSPRSSCPNKGANLGEGIGPGIIGKKQEADAVQIVMWFGGVKPFAKSELHTHSYAHIQNK